MDTNKDMSEPLVEIDLNIHLRGSTISNGGNVEPEKPDLYLLDLNNDTSHLPISNHETNYLNSQVPLSNVFFPRLKH